MNEEQPHETVDREERSPAATSEELQGSAVTMNEEQPHETVDPAERSPEANRREPQGRVAAEAGARVVPFWRKAIGLGVLLAAIGAVVVFVLFEKKYEAEAWIRIENRAPWLVFPSAGDQSRWFAQTETAIVRSPMVLERVLQRPDIAKIPCLAKVPDKITALSEGVKVTRVAESELYRISFACNDPDHAKNIVNAVTEAYFEFRDTTEGERSQKVIELLEKERHAWQQEVIRLRKDILDLERRGNGRAAIGTNPNTDAVEKRPLVDWHGKWTAAKVDCVVLGARLQVAKDEHEKTLRARQIGRGAPERGAGEQQPAPLSELGQRRRDAMVAKMLDENPAIQRLVSAIQAKQVQLSEIEIMLVDGKKNPSHEQKQQEIVRDQRTLERAKDAIRPDLAKQVERLLIVERVEAEDAMVGGQRAELQRMEMELRSLENLEAQFKVENDKEVKAVNFAHADTLDLEFNRDELARAKKVFEQLAQRTLQLQTEQRAPSRVTLMQYAAKPNAPVETYPSKTLAVVVLAGFCLPFLALGVWRFAASCRRSS